MMKVYRLIAITAVILFASLLFADPQFSGEFTVGNLPDYDYLDLTAYNTAWFGLDSNWEICCSDEYLIISGSYNKKNYYYDFIADDQGTHGPDGTVVYALYKIQLRNKGNFFYFDWRDSDYKDGNGEFGTGYPTADCRIYWKNGVYSYDSKFYCFYRESSDTTFINDGDTLKLWEVTGKNQSYPVNKNHFQPTTPTSLSYSWSGSRVNLMWHHSEPQAAATYEVWRRVSSNPPKYLVVVEDWHCIQSLPAGTIAWTDNDFQISGTTNRVQYKVQAVSGDGNLYSPAFSNIVAITGTFLPSDKKPAPPVSINLAVPSCSVFPNPFNSTISINLFSPSDEFAEIAICDLRGRIVKTFRPAPGNYYFDTVWNGADNQGQPLQSGIYFLIARNKSETLFSQKIIYLK